MMKIAKGVDRQHVGYSRRLHYAWRSSP